MTVNPESPAFRAATLAAILARHYPVAMPHRVALTVDMMQRATRSARNFETNQCNYSMTEVQVDRGHKRMANAQARINAMLALTCLFANQPGDAPSRDERVTGLHPAPATVSLGGDCRGPCGSLQVPGLRGDGWGDGFAIY
jgi:hypothetical protein